MASNNGIEQKDIDLLEDSGYTEESSQLPPVNNIKTQVSKMQCPHLQFLDDETNEHTIINNNVDNYGSSCENCEEPQHIMSSIIQKDVEFISREITSTDMSVENNADSDSEELVNGNFQIHQIENSDEDLFCSSPIICLPRELVLKIFAYISQEELCSRVSCVCKLWYDLAFDPVLWKIIDLHNYKDIPSVNLCRLIARATNLRTLILHGRETISESEVTVFSDFLSHLQHLDLGFCQNFNSVMLGIIVHKCPMLESINVEGDTSFKPGSLQVLSRCKHLKDMNFSHTVLDNGDLYWLAKQLDCIRSINIDGISWIEERPVTYLAEQHFEHLQELSIDGAEISDECYKAIGNCTKLTSFESSFCELITDKSLTYLQNLHKLRNLRLRKGTDLTTAGLIGLFSSSAMSNLISLDLSECTGCEDSCVQQITKCCGKNLRALSLCWCWNITDLGATSIVDHCRNVMKLDLTGIDKIYGECFGRVPTEMPHLQLLDLKQCNRIKDELIESVVREKRDLVAINYYGEELEYGAS